MAPTSPVEQRVERPTWPAVVVAVVAWLALASGAGYFAANALNEHGSIVFIPLGAAVGVVGALCHAVALGQSRFRRLAKWRQATFITLLVTGLVTVGAFGIVLNTGGGSKEALSTSLFTLVAAFAPTVAISSVVTYLSRRAA
jgi:hypothetical protein